MLIPGVIGPFIGSQVLANAETLVGSDGTVSFIPNENIFLAALIVAGLLSILIVVFNLIQNKKAKV